MVATLLPLVVDANITKTLSSAFQALFVLFIFKTLIYIVYFLVTVEIYDMTQVFRGSVRYNINGVDPDYWGSQAMVFLSLFLTELLLLFFSSLLLRNLAAIQLKKV